MATKKYVSLEKLGLYDDKIKKVITDGDAAALASAKSYADGLATNYDDAGSAASALADAKSYADGKDTAIQAAQKAADDAAAAASVADGKAVAAQGEVDALETYVGTIPTTATATDIVGYIQEKTAGIATDTALEELTGRVKTAEDAIDAIEADYLKATDKTELAGAIEGVQGAVDAEAERAKGVEGGLETRLKAVEDDYLKAADKTELQGNIDTLTGVVETLRDGVDAEKVDGVKDLIKYVDEHGSEVTGMKEDISENAAAIEGVAGRMTTAEGKITAVEGAVATKAEKTYVDEQVQALQGVDTGLDNRLKAVEAKFGDGDGSVADQIADVKTELQEEIATAIDGAKTDASNKDAVVLAEAQKAATAVQTALDTHTGNGDIHVTTDDKAKWNAALQTSDITTGSANGTVAVKGTDVAVKGLGSAAYVATTTFDASGSAAQALTDAKTYTDEAIAQFVECSQEDINNLFA